MGVSWCSGEVSIVFSAGHFCAIGISPINASKARHGLTRPVQGGPPHLPGARLDAVLGWGGRGDPWGCEVPVWFNLESSAG